MTTYYRLYDIQTGRYMATGLNTTSIQDLFDAYKKYKSIEREDEDTWFDETFDEEQMKSIINSDAFDIETNFTLFSEDK